MAKKRAKLNTEEVPMNMTPMIDVVFQLMIFFLVTFKVDKDQINEQIQLAMSPHGPPMEDVQGDPRRVVIEVDEKGRISIGRNVLPPAVLQGMLHGAVQRNGFGFPVIVRADSRAQHVNVRRVMDACSSVGLYRIRFVAVIKKGS